MRTVDYSEIQRGTTALMGLIKGDSGTGDVDSPTFALLRSFHDRRFQAAWEMHDWPELCRTEHRYFRDLYDPNATYNAGDEVFDPVSGAYYQCLRDGTSGIAPYYASQLGWTASSVMGAGSTGNSYVLVGPLIAGTFKIYVANIQVAHDDGHGNIVPGGTITGGTIVPSGNYIVLNLTYTDPGIDTQIDFNYTRFIAGQNTAYWSPSQTSYSGTNFDSNTGNKQGDIVFYPNNVTYYACFATAPAGTLPTNTSYFGALKPFNRYISPTQTGQTVIGEVFRSHDQDPRMTTKLNEYFPTISADGWQYHENITSVWIYFRLRRPTFTGDPFDATKVYTAGQQAYYTASNGTENFYDVITTTAAGETPESAAAKWALVEIPYIFRQSLIAGGFADWLSQDEQETRAAKHDAMAYAALELEADKLNRQQGQTRRLRWRR